MIYKITLHFFLSFTIYIIISKQKFQLEIYMKNQSVSQCYYKLTEAVCIDNWDYDYECNDDNDSFFYCHNLIINDIDINFLSNFKRIIVIHIIVIFKNDCK